jgi:hypothetical protein
LTALAKKKQEACNILAIRDDREEPHPRMLHDLGTSHVEASRTSESGEGKESLID